MNNKTPWKHSMLLNGICPYFTMFPLDFPYGILKEYSTIGDIVLDPFCGRGTTNYAARLLGLDTYGIDSNPVAVAISEAKLVDTTPQAILKTAHEIIDEVREPKKIPEGEFWDVAFHKDVIKDICKFREAFLGNCSSAERKALRAIIMGALHGPQNKVQKSYFSNQCPRTYAPKPKYAVKFWKKHGFKPEKVDVLKIIEYKTTRFYSSLSNRVNGKIILGDSRCSETYHCINSNKVNWIITSPPYYGLDTYLPDQWIRNWFIGGPQEIEYSKKGQITHFSPIDFANDLRKVWLNTETVCAKGAQMLVRFGGINDRKADPEQMILKSFQDTNWKIEKIIPAGTASQGNRQAASFLKTRKSAREEFDVWALYENQ